MCTETAAAGKLLTQKEVAEHAHVSEKQVCIWRRDPRWRAAVNQTLAEALRESAWLSSELAAAGRARRGSVRDWELYLANGGPTSWRGAGEVTSSGASGGPGAIAGAVTHVHIHGIPEREPFSSLPPPLTLPAQGTAHASAPAK